ncbi:hypothetical protein B0H16DRAFT_1700129, partial [Mycena metata]
MNSRFSICLVGKELELGCQYHNLSSPGGTGGRGGPGGISGGAGGLGQGPMVNFGGGVQTLNNSMHIMNQGPGLEEILYKWLGSPPTTQDKQHELRNLHHEATGCWLQDNIGFMKWKTTPGALWIKGISTDGTHMISSTVIEGILGPQSAVAFFYFDFRNERQHLNLMLRSIVWQLSRWSHPPYSALNHLYKTLGDGTIQPQLFHLQEVLENLLSELGQTWIVIDGLDECNKPDWKHLIKFIHSLCQPSRDKLHLLFTSQPLEEFKNPFKDVTFIELGSAVSNSDIRSFI